MTGFAIGFGLNAGGLTTGSSGDFGKTGFAGVAASVFGGWKFGLSFMASAGWLAGAVLFFEAFSLSAFNLESLSLAGGGGVGRNWRILFS